jgi:Type IV secretion-system coupling protein DNA-binding domain
MIEQVIGGGLLAASGAALFVPWPKPKPPEPVICELAGLKWTREQFCHSWLITGKQGSGKSVAMNALLDQLFSHDQSFGGLWLDNQGDSHMNLVRIAQKHGRKDDVILIEVPFDGRRAYPEQRMNLLKAGNLGSCVMASILSDIASIGQSMGKHTGFFQEQTITHIEAGIRMLEYMKVPVTLKRLKEFLCSEFNMEQAVQQCLKSPNGSPRPVADIVLHWPNEFMSQPGDQLGGVRTSLSNALSPFTTVPEVADVFASDLPDTVDFRLIEKGKIICVLCPTSYPKAKSAINTLMKGVLFYTGKRRYDMRKFMTPKEIADENLLTLFFDEAQHSTVANDRFFFDTLRAAKCAFIAAMQDEASLVPVTGEAVAKTILTKFQNRMIFRSETFESAEKSAAKIGKRRIWRTSYGTSGGKGSSNRSQVDDHIVLPQHFDNLPVHKCAILHTNKRFKRRVKLPVV